MADGPLSTGGLLSPASGDVTTSPSSQPSDTGASPDFASSSMPDGPELRRRTNTTGPGAADSSPAIESAKASASPDPPAAIVPSEEAMSQARAELRRRRHRQQTALEWTWQISMCIAVFLRYSIMSLSYLLILFVHLFALPPRRQKGLVIFTIALSSVFVLLHLIFQLIYLLAPLTLWPPDSAAYEWLVFFGLSRIGSASDAVRLLLPDPLVLIISGFCWYRRVFRRRTPPQRMSRFQFLLLPEDQATEHALRASRRIAELAIAQRLAARDPSLRPLSPAKAADLRKRQFLRGLSSAYLLATFCLLGTLAMALPSIVSLLYFTWALGAVLCWTLLVPVRFRLASMVKMVLLLVLGCHTILSYIYQLTPVHENFPTLVADLFGLVQLFNGGSTPWTAYLAQVVLIVSVLAMRRHLRIKSLLFSRYGIRESIPFRRFAMANDFGSPNGRGSASDSGPPPGELAATAAGVASPRPRSQSFHQSSVRLAPASGDAAPGPFLPRASISSPSAASIYDPRVSGPGAGVGASAGVSAATSAPDLGATSLAISPSGSLAAADMLGYNQTQSLGQMVLRHLALLTPLVLLVWVVSFPTYINLGFLLWALAAMLCRSAPSQLLFVLRSRRLLLLAEVAHLLTIFLFNIRGLPLPSLPEFGLDLFDVPIAVLGPQLLLLALACVLLFPWRRYGLQALVPTGGSTSASCPTTSAHLLSLDHSPCLAGYDGRLALMDMRTELLLQHGLPSVVSSLATDRDPSAGAGIPDDLAEYISPPASPPRTRSNTLDGPSAPDQPLLATLSDPYMEFDFMSELSLTTRASGGPSTAPSLALPSAVAVATPFTPPPQRTFPPEKLGGMRGVFLFMGVCFRLLLRMFIENLYIPTLFVIYMCSLMKVNVFNSIFLVFFLAFLSRKDLAVRYWTLLVLYTAIVSSAQYLWQFSWKDAFVPLDPVTGQPPAWVIILGFEDYHGDLWVGLGLHIGIQAICWLQQTTFGYVSNSPQPDWRAFFPATLPPAADKPADAPRKSCWQYAFLAEVNLLWRMAQSVTRRRMRLVCYVLFLVSSLSSRPSASLMDLGYLIVFYLCTSLAFFGLSRRPVFKVLWLLPVVLAMFNLFLCYLYQFPIVQEWAQEVFAPELLLDIGLHAKLSAELFLYLLHHLAILLLTMSQVAMYVSSGGLFRTGDQSTVFKEATAGAGSATPGSAGTSPGLGPLPDVDASLAHAVAAGTPGQFVGYASAGRYGVSSSRARAATIATSLGQESGSVGGGAGGAGSLSPGVESAHGSGGPAADASSTSDSGAGASAGFGKQSSSGGSHRFTYYLLSSVRILQRIFTQVSPRLIALMLFFSTTAPNLSQLSVLDFITLALALVFAVSRRWQRFFRFPAFIYLSLLVLSRMLFQLRSVQGDLPADMSLIEYVGFRTLPPPGQDGPLADAAPARFMICEILGMLLIVFAPVADKWRKRFAYADWKDRRAARALFVYTRILHMPGMTGPRARQVFASLHATLNRSRFKYNPDMEIALLPVPRAGLYFPDFRELADLVDSAVTADSGSKSAGKSGMSLDSPSADATASVAMAAMTALPADLLPALHEAEHDPDLLADELDQSLSTIGAGSPNVPGLDVGMAPSSMATGKPAPRASPDAEDALPSRTWPLVASRLLSFLAWPFAHFGFELTLILHLVAALVHLNLIGLIYLTILGVHLIVGSGSLRRGGRARRWAWTLLRLVTVILIAWQYFVALGPAPDWPAFPWESLDEGLRFALGLAPEKVGVRLLSADFLLLLCAGIVSGVLRRYAEQDRFEQDIQEAAARVSTSPRVGPLDGKMAASEDTAPVSVNSPYTDAGDMSPEMAVDLAGEGDPSQPLLLTADQAAALATAAREHHVPGPAQPTGWIGQSLAAVGMPESWLRGAGLVAPAGASTDPANMVYLEDFYDYDDYHDSSDQNMLLLSLDLPLGADMSHPCSVEDDFTVTPRTIFNEMRLLAYRYFYRLVIILTFTCGTSVVSLLSFIYLVFSLYFLSIGENVIKNEALRRRAWRYYRLYNYFWFFVLIAYQLPAYIVELPANIQNIMSIIGFSKLTLNPMDVTPPPGEGSLAGLLTSTLLGGLLPASSEQVSLAFSNARILNLFVFLAMLIQQMIFDSTRFEFLRAYLVKEDLQAVEQQVRYQEKQRADRERRNKEINDNFARSEKKYQSMSKKFYARWAGVTFRGRRDLPELTIEQTAASGDPSVFFASESLLDLSASTTNTGTGTGTAAATPGAGTSSSMTFPGSPGLEHVSQSHARHMASAALLDGPPSPSVSAVGLDAGTGGDPLPAGAVQADVSLMFESETGRVIHPPSSEAGEPGSSALPAGGAASSANDLSQALAEAGLPHPTAQQPWYNRAMDALIFLLYAGCADYCELEQLPTVASLRVELQKTRSVATRVWLILQGVTLCLVAHVHLLVYFFIFLNQVLNASILSTIPAVVVLLFGVHVPALSPIRPQHIWRFIIYYTEAVILAKYIAQFPMGWDINVVDCEAAALPDDFQYPWFVVLGLQKYCSSLFSPHIISELAILVFSFSQRSVMQRVGLWDTHTAASASSHDAMAMELRAARALAKADPGTFDDSEGEDSDDEHGPDRQHGHHYHHGAGMGSPDLESSFGLYHPPVHAPGSGPVTGVLLPELLAADGAGMSLSRAVPPAPASDATGLSVSLNSLSTDYQEVDVDFSPGIADDDTSVVDDAQPSPPPGVVPASPTDGAAPEDVPALASRPTVSFAPDLVATEFLDVSLEETCKPEKPGFLSVVTDPIISFIQRASSPNELDSLGHDYYLAMFFADILVFLLTIFFFGDFSTSMDSDIETILSQNTVPTFFLVIAITEFILIIFDRMIYAAKASPLKLLMQLFTVIAYHLWIFFVLPAAKQSYFHKIGILPVWYLFKCFYWYSSACQLRDGYKRMDIGLMFLTQYHGVVARYTYMGYRMIPFVFELRCLLDWSVKKTTLDFFQWVKLEDLYSTNYDIKCFREMQKRRNRKVGDPYPNYLQLPMGWGFIIGIVLLLWFPLILISLPGATVTNNPNQVSISVRLNNFDDFYTQATGAEDDISLFTPGDLDDFYKKYPTLVGSSTLTYANYALVRFEPDSRTTWMIPPPSRAAMAEQLLLRPDENYLTVTIQMNRPSAYASKASGSFVRTLSAEESQNLGILMTTTTCIHIQSLMPYVIRAVPNGDIRSYAATSRSGTQTGQPPVIDIDLHHAAGRIIYSDTDSTYVDWFSLRGLLEDGDRNPQCLKPTPPAPRLVNLMMAAGFGPVADRPMDVSPTAGIQCAGGSPFVSSVSNETDSGEAAAAAAACWLARPDLGILSTPFGAGANPIGPALAAGMEASSGADISINDFEGMEFVVVSDNVAANPSIGSYGIIGLYVLVVYTVGNILRVTLTGAAQKIMFEDLPNVDKILEMIHDVYIAREFKGLVMEEELYRELIELYRDPDALIEISKAI